jgi:ELWxxDGT repeat protein
MVVDVHAGAKSGTAYDDGSQQGVGTGQLLGQMTRWAVHKSDGTEKALYFTGMDSKGCGLYKYDGTSAPHRVWTGVFSANNIYIPSTTLAATSNNIFFNDHHINGTAMMSYDVTTGTTNVIFPYSFYEPLFHTALKNKVYFSVLDTLVEHDPATGITKKIQYFGSNGTYFNFLHMTAIGSSIYFATPYAVYRYDGTGAPARIAGLSDNYTVPYNQPTWAIGEYKGKVYFPCKDANNRCLPCEYDPATKAVTRLTKGDNPYNFVACKGKLYFSAKDSNDMANHNYELWSYDGITAPKMEVDINPGKEGSQPIFITNYNDVLYFTANMTKFDASGMENIGMYELLKYDPSKAVTGVSSVGFTGNIHVYPNPVTTVCNIAIDLPEKSTLALRVYNVMGQPVYSLPQTVYMAGKNSVTVPMANLATGTYAYIISDENGKLMHSGRIQKQ